MSVPVRRASSCGDAPTIRPGDEGPAAAGCLGGRLHEHFNRYTAPATELNIVDRLVPRSVTATRTTSAMKATRNAYSTSVWPSSRDNLASSTDQNSLMLSHIRGH